MSKIAMDYYKDLFAWEPRPKLRLKHDFFSEDEKISEEENLGLGAPFTEEEVRVAVFGSYAEGAPGPDGLSFLFYQSFGILLKLTCYPCLMHGMRIILIFLD